MLTDVLDLLGALLVVAGVALGVGLLWGVPAALGAAGVCLLSLSWLIDRLRKGRK